MRKVFKYILFSLIMVISSIAYVSCGNKDKSFSVSGYVMCENGYIEDAIVTSDIGTIKTDANGFYEFKGLYSGITISIEHPNYFFPNSIATAFSHADNIDFIGYTYYDVNGVVKSGDESVPNAIVYADGLMSCKSETNINGEFKIKNVAGKAEVTILKDGYKFESQDVTLRNHNNIIFDGKTNVSVAIEYHDNVERPNFDIEIGDDLYGNCELNQKFNDISVGSIVKPVKNGVLFVPESYEVKKEDELIEFQAYNVYDYATTVFCGTTPLANVEVWVDGKLETTTNSNGSFSLANLYGTKEIVLKLNGYIFNKYSINYEYQPSKILAKKAVYARVVDDIGAPIKDVVVSCGDNVSSTDSNGYFELNECEIGDVLTFIKEGYLIEDVVLDLARLSNVYAFKVYSAKISVLCNEKPLSGVNVNIQTSAGEKSFKTNASGELFLSGLTGEIEVSLSKNGYHMNGSILLNSDNNEFCVEAKKIYALMINSSNEFNLFIKQSNKNYQIKSGEVFTLTYLYGEKNIILERNNYNPVEIVINEDNCTFNDIVFEYNIAGVVKTGIVPIKDVAVKDLDGNELAITDKDGKFKINNLSNEKTLVFEKEGYVFNLKPVVFQNNSNIEIQGTYSISGVCKTQNIESGIVVELLNDESSEVRTSTTDENGIYRFSGLSGVNTVYIPNIEAFSTIVHNEITSYGKYDFIADSYKISGYVKTGNVPIEKVKITAGEYVTYTDENGFYEFSSLSDSVEFVLEKEGFIFSGDMRVDNTKKDTNVNFNATYKIVGVIKCVSVLADVNVKLNDEELLNTSDGYFEISDLCGQNTLSFSKYGYNFKDIVICGYESLEVLASYFVEGYIKCGDSFVSNVVITDGNSSTKSDLSGYFKLDDLSETTTIQFALNGYNIANSEVSGYLSIEKQSSYAVSGIIKNGTKAIPDVEVFVNNSLMAKTNNVGEFEIKELVGINDLSFSHVSYEVARENVSAPILNKVFKATYTILGYVKLNNVGMENVEVSAQGLTTKTGSNGFYSLAGLSGEGVLDVRLAGYSFVGSREFDSPKELDFTAQYSIKGLVYSGNIKIANAKISYDGSFVTSNALGEFEINNLTSPVSLNVEKEGYNFNQTLNFSDRNLDIKIEMHYNVKGKIESSKSVQNVKVVIEDSKGVRDTFTTSASGEFSFNEVYGKSVIKFSKNGFRFDDIYLQKENLNIVSNPVIVYSISGGIKAGSYAIGDAIVDAGKFTSNVKMDNNGNFTISDVDGQITIKAVLNMHGCTKFISNQVTISEGSQTTGIQLSFDLNDYCYYMYEQGLQRMKDNTYETELKGTVELSVGGTQQVRGFKKKGKDNNILFEQLNYGKEILGVDPRMAIRSYLDLKNEPNNVYYKQTKNVSTSCVPTYSGDYQSISYAGYKNKYGVDPQGFFPYLITQSTVSSISDINKDGTKLKFTFNLNTTTAVGNYKINMKAMSGEQADKFNFIKVTFEFDGAVLTNSRCYEQYTIVKGVTVTATGDLKESYRITNGATVVEKV